MLRAQRPYWVMTDLNMPGMEGFEMLRFLRKPSLGMEALRVVVTSALLPQDIQPRGGLPRDVIFLPKPLHLGGLEAVVCDF